MNNMKKVVGVIGAAVAVIAIACYLLVGGKEDPAKSVEGYTVAFVHQDKEKADKAKIPYEKMHKQLISAFAKGFRQESGNAVNQKQSEAIAEAYFAQWKKLDVHTKKISENGTKAVVEITIGKLSPVDFDALRAKIQAIPNDPATRAKRGDIIVDIYKEAYEARQQAGTVSFEIECQYNAKDKIWIPTDVKNYADQVKAAIDNLEG